MTISSTTRRAGPFAGNGVTTVFPFTFKVFAKTDVSVAVVDFLGNQVVLTLDSDYSVTLNADQNANPGGAITYPLSGSPLPAGSSLAAIGSLLQLQPTDITNNGGFYPSVVEDAFDRAVILIQQLQELLGRQVVAPVTDAAPVVQLPTAAQRANKGLGFDTDGNVIAVDLTIGSVLAPVVHSIAMLRLASRLFTTDVFVLGYYQIADGGGGAYSLDASDTTSADNGGTVIVAADGGRWKLQHSGKVSIKQFGGKGDGVTDDTAIVVTATATGLTIFLPNSTYVMSNTVFTTGMTLEGEDKFNTVILWKGASAEANLFGFSAFVGNVTIRNLTINSNFQNQTDSTGYYGAIGGSLGSGARLTLNEVAFINGRISDIYLSGPTGSGQFASVSITKCLFTNGLVGTATRAAQAVGLSEGIALDFSQNQMIQPTAPASYGRGGCVVQRVPGSTSLSFAKVSVKDNYFENFGLSGSNVLGCVYIYSGAEQVVISGNESKNSYGAAYCAKADSGNVVIANNSVVNHTDPAVSPIVFFNQAVSYTSSIGVNLVIEGNTVTGYTTAGIFVDGGRISLANFSNIVVANNTCNGGQYGVHYRNVTNARISGNVISATTSEAIFGEAEIGDVSITDNTIAGGVVGVDINGATSSANIEVSRNILTALTGSAIRLRTAVNSFFINENIIAGCTQAFTTTGAAASSAIRNNIVSGETGSWSYSGTYGQLQFEHNIFSVPVPFSQRSLAMDATGAITAIADWHYVDTYSSAASGNLYTINGAYDGRQLTLFAAASSRVVTLVPDTGNLKLAGNFALSSGNYTITLVARGGVWYEKSRSANT